MAYTARQIWNAALTETNKTGAPAMLLSDYNYFINKAINQYVNEHYTIYDISQQTTDDLRVLKASAFLKVKNVNYNPQIDGTVFNMNTLGAGLSKLFAGTYEVILPQDYLHMLSCNCIFELLSDFDCYDKGNYIPFAATRLTSDKKAEIEGNSYLRPLPQRPYYCIHNVNVSDEIATNPRDPDNNPYGTDYTTSFKTDYENLKNEPTGDSIDTDPTKAVIKQYDSSKDAYVKVESTYDPTYKVFKVTNDYYNLQGQEVEEWISGDNKKYLIKENGKSVAVIYESTTTPTVPSITGSVKENKKYSANSPNPGFNRTITIKNPYTKESEKLDIVDVKPAGLRMGNQTGVRCEFLCGKDDSVYKLRYVQIDYIKAPQHIRLTQEQIDLTRDTSQLMEFPDYVCQEIINKLILLLMENQSNQRLQTHPQVSQSINYQNTASQQAQQQAQQQQR